MTFDSMVPSRFLKKADFEKPGLLTIKKFEQDNVAPEGQAPENKWVMYFNEVDRGIVLGPTNIELLKIATGVNGPADAVGKKVVIYVDPTISMGGKVVGGLRIRAPKGSQPDPVPAAEESPAPF